jgi:Na+/H+ antiporter NhaD/arsenite permease-like protein
MKSYQINIANSSILIVVGLLGYFMSNKPSPTAFIPVVAGIILLAMNSGLKKEHKTIAHVVVLLTLLLFISLIMPLKGAMKREDTGGIIRVGLMVLSSAVAFALYIKNFVDARKARQQ